MAGVPLIAVPLGPNLGLPVAVQPKAQWPRAQPSTPVINMDGVANTSTYNKPLYVSPDGTYATSAGLLPQGNVAAKSAPSGWMNAALDDSITAFRFDLYIEWASVEVNQAGRTLTLPPSTANALCPAPDLTQVAGGTLAARSYAVQAAYVRNGVLHGLPGGGSLSPASTLNVSANYLLRVSPPLYVAGYDGWVPLIGLNSAQPSVPPDLLTVGTPLRPLGFGVSYTEPSTGAAAGWTYNYSDASSGALHIPVARASAYDVYLYPAYRLDANRIELEGSNPLTAVSQAAAIAQSGDQRIALSAGSVVIALPNPGSVNATGGGGGGGAGQS